MTDATNETVEAWVAEARELGREHAQGLPGGGQGPMEIIDLNALEAETGEGTSWGELADIQAALEEAYEQGRRGA